MQQRKKANETNGREPRNGKRNATSDALNAEARERANGRGSAKRENYDKKLRLCYACKCKSIVRGLPLPPQHTTLHRLQQYLTRVAPQVRTISGYAMRHICVNQIAHTAKTHIRAIDTQPRKSRSPSSVRCMPPACGLRRDAERGPAARTGGRQRRRRTRDLRRRGVRRVAFARAPSACPGGGKV